MLIVFLHSSRGLRPSVHAVADRLRAGGHDVVVPDLFEGVTFTDVDEGVAHADELGWPVLLERAKAAIPASGPIALAGMSMGAGLAMAIAAFRPEVRRVLLLHAAFPWDGEWPGVPVEAHYAVDDRWVDGGEPAALLEQVARSGAAASLHVYPPAAHLFTDPDLPGEYDERSAELLWQRALAFLAGA